VGSHPARSIIYMILLHPIRKIGKQHYATVCSMQVLVLFLFFDSQYTNEKKCKGLQVEVCFCLPCNKNDYHVSGGKLVLKLDHQLYPARKDIDNMIKFVLGAMHTVFYDDDKAIIDIHSMKGFISDSSSHGDIPFMTITMFPKNRNNTI
jgi:Endodeoxyribonuclease RusA